MSYTPDEIKFIKDQAAKGYDEATARKNFAAYQASKATSSASVASSGLLSKVANFAGDVVGNIPGVGQAVRGASQLYNYASKPNYFSQMGDLNQPYKPLYQGVKDAVNIAKNTVYGAGQMIGLGMQSLGLSKGKGIGATAVDLLIGDLNAVDKTTNNFISTLGQATGNLLTGTTLSPAGQAAAGLAGSLGETFAGYNGQNIGLGTNWGGLVKSGLGATERAGLTILMAKGMDYTLSKFKGKSFTTKELTDTFYDSTKNILSKKDKGFSELLLKVKGVDERNSINSFKQYENLKLKTQATGIKLLDVGKKFKSTKSILNEKGEIEFLESPTEYLVKNNFTKGMDSLKMKLDEVGSKLETLRSDESIINKPLDISNLKSNWNNLMGTKNVTFTEANKVNKEVITSLPRDANSYQELLAKLNSDINNISTMKDALNTVEGWYQTLYTKKTRDLIPTEAKGKTLIKMTIGELKDTLSKNFDMLKGSKEYSTMLSNYSELAGLRGDLVEATNVDIFNINPLKGDYKKLSNFFENSQSASFNDFFSQLRYMADTYKIEGIDDLGELFSFNTAVENAYELSIAKNMTKQYIQAMKAFKNKDLMGTVLNYLQSKINVTENIGNIMGKNISTKFSSKINKIGTALNTATNAVKNNLIPASTGALTNQQ